MSSYGTALYTNGVLSVYQAGEVEHPWFVIVDTNADNLVRRVGDLATAQAMVDAAVVGGYSTPPGLHRVAPGARVAVPKPAAQPYAPSHRIDLRGDLVAHRTLGAGA